LTEAGRKLYAKRAGVEGTTSWGAQRFDLRRSRYRGLAETLLQDSATEAKIEKRVYPHLLRHSVVTTLLERGMSSEQIQKFLGHSNLGTTQICAESTAEIIKESCQAALGG
jgi:integrase/recombinase XerD